MMGSQGVARQPQELQKLGHKAVFSDSGMEYKPETRTSSSDLYLMR